MDETDNGMKRENKSEKLNYLDALDPYVLKRYVKHLKKGEAKHGRGNWKKGGYPLNEYLESTMRHFMQLWANYEATGLSTVDDEDHLSACIFNLMAFAREEHLQDTLAARLSKARTPITSPDHHS